jgi:hypothetical protein
MSTCSVISKEPHKRHRSTDLVGYCLDRQMSKWCSGCLIFEGERVV